VSYPCVFFNRKPILLLFYILKFTNEDFSHRFGQNQIPKDSNLALELATPAVAPLHLWWLPSTSTCDRSPPPAIASLHLRSLPSTCGRTPSTCYSSPPPAIAPLHLRSLSSTCYRFPPPAIALLHLRSLPFTCDRSSPLALHRGACDHLPARWLLGKDPKNSRPPITIFF
jgi:hypothetical protein